MPAMTAFTQLLHLFNSSLSLFLFPHALPPRRPRAPKKGHYSGRATKAKTVTSLARSQRAMLFNPAYPHKCARFSSPDATLLASLDVLAPSRHKRSTCPYLNSQWQSIISAVWRRRRWLAAPSLCSAPLELQVLLFPAAFQCAGLADRTKEEDDLAARARRVA